MDAPPDALMCTSPQIKCGDMCVNPTTDNNHCGDCSTVCGNGSSCQTDGSSSKCCPTGQHNCGGTCVDETSDELHCGSCTNACLSNQTCDNGTCCGNGTTVCTTSSGPQCFDTNTDENHCGSCTTMCASDETCTTETNNTNPKCCTTGDNNCGGTCSDPKTDNNNCGGCGAVCPNGSTCSDGKCCGAGTVSCDGVSCVSPQDDTSCGATATSCGTNCSTQGKVCKTNSAQTSEICCSSSQNNCGGTCSDPLTDNNNCGGCGNVCGTGLSCSNGVCCGPGESGCGSGASAVCVDFNTDDAHCGGCNTACTGSTPVCDGAQCAAQCDATTSPPATNCSGDCVFTGTDHNHCGDCTTKCAANQVCSAGVCTTSCPNGTTSCGGSCVDTSTDPNHCGSCGGLNSVCPPGDECVAGVCQINCAPGELLCGGICINPLNNNNNCSPNNTCGVACGSNQTCDDGVCCTAPTVNCSGGTTAAACVDPSADATCGATTSSCGQNCTAASKTCMTSGTTHVCCAAGQTNCGGVCVDTKTDGANCGGCAGTATGDTCDPGEACSNGLCCTSPGTVNKGGVCCSTATNIIACNSQCVDKNSDKNNCGGCGNVCPGSQICNNGSCATACTSPNNTDCQDSGVPVCTNPQTDPFHCGDPACAWCTSGTCTSGVCQSCAAKDPNFPKQCGTGPGSVCTNLTNDEDNCGACGTVCQSFETCVHDPSVTTEGAPGFGTCCTTGLATCGGTCVNLQSGTFDNSTGQTFNCGSCGNTCAAGASCTNGTCQCPFGTTSCGGSCKSTVADPANCGGCGITCSGTNNVCVSGECVSTCPAPLIKCGNKCVNPDDDNANCGGCAGAGGTACTGNNGCSAGACVPVLGPFTPTNPARCAGGGGPIVVPGGGGSGQCTGNIGAVSFQFGLCSRTNLGPLSQALTTDAFDSTIGAYHTCTANNSAQCSSLHCRDTKATCTGSAGTQGSCGTGDICDYPVKCVAGQCVGGGVGVNGWVTPVASDTAATTVGGDFWVFGLNGVSHAIATGLAMKGATVVKTQFINHGSLDLSKTSQVYGKSYVTGAWTSGGNADMTLTGLLTIPGTCNPLPAGTLHTNGGCTTAAFPGAAYPFTTANPPCGRNDNTDSSLIDIRSIVTYFSSPTHNDNNNVTPPIPYTALDGSSSATIRLDLPCGYYYFNMMNIGKDTTIVVHGRTAIFIGGAMRVSQKLILDLDPGATLDIFVGAAVNVSNIVELGSPAFPRRSRLWIGGTGCLGTGTCSGANANSTCCSGVCTNGVCAAGGGGNLSQAMSLSNGGAFNGLIWAGYGTFTHSNPLEMYGSIYTNYFDASGDTTVHYDKGAIGTAEECPPPPPNAACESCRQCSNQPCLVDPADSQKKCGFKCTQNSDCCAPLTCTVSTGVCQ